MTGKRMWDIFFTQNQNDPQKLLCRCNTKRSVKCSGYTNLVNYQCETHPDEYSCTIGGAAAQLSSRDSNMFCEVKSEEFPRKP